MWPRSDALTEFSQAADVAYKALLNAKRSEAAMKCTNCGREIAEAANWVRVQVNGRPIAFHFACFARAPRLFLGLVARAAKQVDALTLH